MNMLKCGIPLGCCTLALTGVGAQALRQNPAWSAELPSQNSQRNRLETSRSVQLHAVHAYFSGEAEGTLGYDIGLQGQTLALLEPHHHLHNQYEPLQMNVCTLKSPRTEPGAVSAVCSRIRRIRAMWWCSHTTHF